MSTIEKSVEVDVPITTAYNQWTQMESYPAFMSSVDEVKQIDDTRTHWRVNVAGVDREFDSEITDQVRDQHIAWRSIGELHHNGRVAFEEVGTDATKVTLTMEWEPEGFVEKAGDLLQIDDMTIKRDLEKFKEMIEGQGFESGAWRGEVTGGTVTDSPDNSRDVE
ncbi:MAG: cyclase [Actinobacteria bacterium HGW-Actinobacteria-4]|nr:MAG: cyclase [Actinobacteria bacterium HGW-Actinobacteria-4]